MELREALAGFSRLAIVGVGSTRGLHAVKWGVVSVVSAMFYAFWLYIKVEIRK